MNNYQDLYKKNGLILSKCAEERINNLKINRKNKRNEALDYRREQIITDSEDSISSRKMNTTLKDHLKLKWRPIKKETSTKNRLPPFIVGVVRHKIHSPPFLHEPLDDIEQIKNCSHNSRQSFAPKNYKFKPPKEIEVKVFTPAKAENNQSSPFTLKTLLSNVGDSNVNKKEINLENINTLPRKITISYDSPFSINSETQIEKEYDKNNFDSIKKQLWAEDPEDSPIFGRLNVVKAIQKSTNDFVKDKKETSSPPKFEKDITLPDAVTFNCIPMTDATHLKTHQELNTFPNEVLQLHPSLIINTPDCEEKYTSSSKIDEIICAENNINNKTGNLLHEEPTVFLESIISPIPKLKIPVELDEHEENVNVNKNTLLYPSYQSPKKKLNSESSFETIDIEDEEEETNDEVKNEISYDSIFLREKNTSASQHTKTQNITNLSVIDDKDNSRNIDQNNLFSPFHKSSKKEISTTSPSDVKNDNGGEKRHYKDENISLNDSNSLPEIITKPSINYSTSQDATDPQESDVEGNSTSVNKNTSSSPSHDTSSIKLNVILSPETVEEETNYQSESLMFDNFKFEPKTIPRSSLNHTDPHDEIDVQESDRTNSVNIDVNNLSYPTDNSPKYSINRKNPSEIKNNETKNIINDESENIISSDLNFLPDMVTILPLECIESPDALNNEETDVNKNSVKSPSTNLVKRQINTIPAQSKHLHTDFEESRTSDEEENIITYDLNTLSKVTRRPSLDHSNSQIISNHKESDIKNVNRIVLTSPSTNLARVLISAHSPSKSVDIVAKENASSEEDEDVINDAFNSVTQMNIKRSLVHEKSQYGINNINFDNNENNKSSNRSTSSPLRDSPIKEIDTTSVSETLKVEDENHKTSDEDENIKDNLNYLPVEISKMSLNNTNLQGVINPRKCDAKINSENVSKKSLESPSDNSLKRPINQNSPLKIINIINEENRINDERSQSPDSEMEQINSILSFPNKATAVEQKRTNNVDHDQISDYSNSSLEKFMRPLLDHTKSLDGITSLETDENENRANVDQIHLSSEKCDSFNEEISTFFSAINGIVDNELKNNEENDNIIFDNSNSSPETITKSFLEPIKLRNITSPSEFQNDIVISAVSTFPPEKLKRHLLDPTKSQDEINSTETDDKKYITNIDHHNLSSQRDASPDREINRTFSLKEVEGEQINENYEDKNRKYDDTNSLSKVIELQNAPDYRESSDKNSPNINKNSFSRKISTILPFESKDTNSVNERTNYETGMSAESTSLLKTITNSPLFNRSKAQDTINSSETDNKENQANVEQNNLLDEFVYPLNNDIDTITPVIIDADAEQLRENDKVEKLINHDSKSIPGTITSPSLQCTQSKDIVESLESNTKENTANVDKSTLSSPSRDSPDKKANTIFPSENIETEVKETRIDDENLTLDDTNSIMITNSSLDRSETQDVIDPSNYIKNCSNISPNNLPTQSENSFKSEMNSFPEVIDREGEKNSVIDKNIMSNDSCFLPEKNIRSSLGQTNSEDFFDPKKSDFKENNVDVNTNTMSVSVINLNDIFDTITSPSSDCTESEELMNPLECDVKRNSASINKNTLLSSSFDFPRDHLNRTFTSKSNNNIANKEKIINDQEIAIGSSLDINKSQDQINPVESDVEKCININNTSLITSPREKMSITDTSQNNKDENTTYDESNHLLEVINNSSLDQTKEQQLTVPEHCDEKKKIPEVIKNVLQSPLYDSDNNQNNITSLTKSTDTISEEENRTGQDESKFLPVRRTLELSEQNQETNLRKSDINEKITNANNDTLFFPTFDASEKHTSTLSPSSSNNSSRKKINTTYSLEEKNRDIEEINSNDKNTRIKSDDSVFPSENTTDELIDHIVQNESYSSNSPINITHSSENKNLIGNKKCSIDEDENTEYDESRSLPLITTRPYLSKTQDPMNYRKNAVRKKTAKFNENTLSSSSNDSPMKQTNTLSPIENTVDVEKNKNSCEETITEPILYSSALRLQNTKKSKKCNIKENTVKDNENISSFLLKESPKRQNKIRTRDEGNKSNDKDDIMICYESKSLSDNEKLLLYHIKTENVRKNEELGVEEKFTEVAENTSPSGLSKHDSNKEKENTVPLKLKVENTTPLKNKNISVKNTRSNKGTTEHPNIIINLVTSPVKDKVLGKSKKSRPCKDSSIPHSKKLINVNDFPESNENETVDLVSDDEEDYTLFLSRVLATHVHSSTSPKSNLGRIAMASIENIPKKASTPGRSPRSHLYSKDKSQNISMTESPLRILCLRNRTVDISPSPKKSLQEKKKRTNKNL